MPCKRGQGVGSCRSEVVVSALPAIVRLQATAGSSSEIDRTVPKRRGDKTPYMAVIRGWSRNMHFQLAVASFWGHCKQFNQGCYASILAKRPATLVHGASYRRR